MPKLLPLSIIAALGAVAIIWLQIKVLDVTTYQLRKAEQERDAYMTAAGQMGKMAQANAAEAAQLTTQLQTLQQHSRHRDQQWEKLKREHADLKQWADAQLPADVGRLHQRPALTGAAEYQRWLQQSNNLHLTGEQPANQ